MLFEPGLCSRFGELLPELTGSAEHSASQTATGTDRELLPANAVPHRRELGAELCPEERVQ